MLTVASALGNNVVAKEVANRALVLLALPVPAFQQVGAPVCPPTLSPVPMASPRRSA